MLIISLLSRLYEYWSWKINMVLQWVLIYKHGSHTDVDTYIILTVNIDLWHSLNNHPYFVLICTHIIIIYKYTMYIQINQV